MNFDDSAEALRSLSRKQFPHWDSYLGFYSSWLGGYFREPWAMLMPLDDHGFHRGDGVFEAVRIFESAYFDLQAHLERLKRSAEAIGIELPKSLPEIAQICVHLAALCQAESGVLRLYVTRGPGGFSPSPREVTAAQIYAAITKMKSPETRFYEQGCRAMFSTVAAKDPFWSRIKSCNYLQNVLMKKETLERGFDFSICIDSAGRLCEGSTENFLLVNAAGELIVPRFDYTLRGTTVSVVLELAQELVARGELKSAGLGDVHKDDLLGAREAAFVGTTLGVLPIGEVEGHKIPAAGSVSRHLQRELLKKMATDAKLRTPF